MDGKFEADTSEGQFPFSDAKSGRFRKVGPGTFLGSTTPQPYPELDNKNSYNLITHFEFPAPFNRKFPYSMASTTAQRRLLQEYRALTNNPPEGITAGPVSEDDMLYWEALIQGPEGTPFEGGIFPAELKFPKDYPLAPPTMRFLGEVWHPNGKSRAYYSLPITKNSLQVEQY